MLCLIPATSFGSVLWERLRSLHLCGASLSGLSHLFCDHRVGTKKAAAPVLGAAATVCVCVHRISSMAFSCWLSWTCGSLPGELTRVCPAPRHPSVQLTSTWGCCWFYLHLLCFICPRTIVSLDLPLHRNQRKPNTSKILQSSSSRSCESQGPWQKLFNWRFSTALVSQTTASTRGPHNVKVHCATQYLTLFFQTHHNVKRKNLEYFFQFVLNPAMHLCHAGLTRLTSCGCLSCISSTVSAADSVFSARCGRMQWM